MSYCSHKPSITFALRLPCPALASFTALSSALDCFRVAPETARLFFFRCFFFSFAAAFSASTAK